MNRLKLIIILIIGLLSTTAAVAQDTLITNTRDTLLIELRRTGRKNTRFYRYGDRTQLLQAPNQQIKTILRENKVPQREDSDTLSPPQDGAQLWKITTINGKWFVAQILARDSQYLKLRTKRIDSLAFPRSNIKTTNPYLKDHSSSSLWPENPQPTRYFFSPSSYNLKQGEGYYQNVGIGYNQGRVGITDQFSIGFGTIPLFLVRGPTPVWVSPKLTLPVEPHKFQLGLGTVTGTILGEEGGGFSIFFGSMTIGNPDNHLSINMGHGIADGVWADGPAFSISGILRIGEKGYLLTDNLILTGTGASFPYSFLSFGARTAWPNIMLDYGLLLPLIEMDSLVALPWLGISVPFGQN